MKTRGSFVLSYDLGTGGNKASLYNEAGHVQASTFIPYETVYPETGWHEQRPLDWWIAVVKSTRELLRQSPINPPDIVCISISGHSLGAVPLDRDGELLREYTPIWSDTRTEAQTREFFQRIDRRTWYFTTGNGFPAECYPVFKVMWYRDREPGLFKRTRWILGTKDFINYRLTGNICTDYSYASGSGVYALTAWKYQEEFIETSGLPAYLFPEIYPSTHQVGELTRAAAAELELVQGIPVICGGVDNSCMAVGARNIAEGRVYTSLGSSSWIAVSSRAPVLEASSRPFVFTHVVPEMFTSAVSIFAAGSALKWVKDTLCTDLETRAKEKGEDIYDVMSNLAATSPIGSHKILFNPSLAGGTSQDPGPLIRGGYTGLDLRHHRPDLIRAAMEGVAMNLSLVLTVLRNSTALSDEMVMVGGGSKSQFWLQIFADTYNMKVIKTNIDQNAGSLGAAAIGAVGVGLWPDFSRIDQIHQVEFIKKPVPENSHKYARLMEVFQRYRDMQAEMGKLLHILDL